MREGYGLTRAEFAQLTGFGKATVGRWERGEVTQNRSADRYLRLLQEPGVMRQLRALWESTNSRGLQTPARQPGPDIRLPSGLESEPSPRAQKEMASRVEREPRPGI